MSTIDTSTWNPDADLNTAIEGIPLNADAGIAQTWKALRVLMAAVKGDGDAIKSMIDIMQGATASADGASGLVPKPEAGDQDKVLKGDGTWGTLSATDIPNIDASKIASGTIDLARLPAGALERLVPVADQTARFALTTADVQTGDTVKEADTGLLYFVVDTAHLDSDAGYEVYTAGAASAVPWSGVTGKPSSFTPSSHAHGSITNDGKLSTASRVVVTDGSKAIGVSGVTATELGYLSGVTSAVQTQINALETALDNMLKTKIYPVGSTYFSLTDSRNPSVILGFGTWTAIEGKFLLGASSTYAADSTGGEATHTLTVDEIPAHSHPIVLNPGSDFGSGIPYTSGGKTNSSFVRSAGGGQAHNNMPPYLAGYLWRRTA